MFCSPRVPQRRLVRFLGIPGLVLLWYCTVYYIYRTVRYRVRYRTENLEILERGGAALMGYDNDRREAPRIKAL